MNWDNLDYHLRLVNHWLQAKSLYAPDCGHWTNPGNNEVLALWATGAFSGDFLASLNNLGPTIVFACSVVGLGTALGMRPVMANLTGFVAVGNFVVFNQLTSNENDVAVAACFFAAASYALRFAAEANRQDLYGSAISLGLLAGIKFYAAGYAVHGLGLLALVTGVAKGPRAAFRAFLVGMVGILLLGGYWYVRNLVITDSPFYPKEFWSATDTLTKIYPEVGSTSFFGNGQAQLLPLFVSAIWEMLGPCHLVSFVGMPLLLGWLLRPKRMYYLSNGSGAKWSVVWVYFLAGAGLLLAITPFAVEDSPGTLNQLRWRYCPVRYGFCFLNILNIAFVCVISDLLKSLERSRDRSSTEGKGWRWKVAHSVLIALLIGAYIFQLVHVPRPSRMDPLFCWLFATNGVLAFIIGAMAFSIFPRLTRLCVVVVVVAGVLVSSCLADALSRGWHAEFEPYYGRTFDMPSFPDDPSRRLTVCVLENCCYPYFGSRRQRRVCQPVYAPPGDWLLRYFEREEVGFVILRVEPSESAIRRFPSMQECILENPRMFRTAANRSVLAVYEFLGRSFK